MTCLKLRSFYLLLGVLVLLFGFIGLNKVDATTVESSLFYGSTETYPYTTYSRWFPYGVTLAGGSAVDIGASSQTVSAIRWLWTKRSTNCSTATIGVYYSDTATSTSYTSINFYYANSYTGYCAYAVSGGIDLPTGKYIRYMTTAYTNNMPGWSSFNKGYMSNATYTGIISGTPAFQLCSNTGSPTCTGTWSTFDPNVVFQNIVPADKSNILSTMPTLSFDYYNIIGATKVSYNLFRVDQSGNWFDVYHDQIMDISSGSGSFSTTTPVLQLATKYIFYPVIYDPTATTTVYKKGSNITFYTPGWFLTDVGTTTDYIIESYECSITEIMGCIKNALNSLFYPSNSIINSYSTLGDTLKTKSPIGYFYDITGSLGGISTSTTKKFNITIPSNLKTYFFDIFDIAVSYIIYFSFAVHFFNRLKHITV